jgi:hypothetical protein
MPFVTFKVAETIPPLPGTPPPKFPYPPLAPKAITCIFEVVGMKVSIFPV